MLALLILEIDLTDELLNAVIPINPKAVLLMKCRRGCWKFSMFWVLKSVKLVNQKSLHGKFPIIGLMPLFKANSECLWNVIQTIFPAMAGSL